MPVANQFRHQDYAPPADPEQIEYVSAEPPPPLGSSLFRTRMRRVAEQLRDHQVQALYLVHGTFVGDDALGVLRELARLVPALAEPLSALQKQTIERMLQDAGNFTPHYAQVLSDHLNAGFSTPVEVRLFQWTSENHHLGRADGAVQLLDDLTRAAWYERGRVLLWGHSHGGNLFALISNLLGSDRETVARFFQATEVYFHRGDGHAADHASWHRIRDALQQDPSPLARRHLDLVTMGTPVRYGWDRNGYGQLLHFVHHRCHEGLPRFQMHFPPTLDDAWLAASGDLIQWLGIAGTNFAPPMWSWRAWLADRRLHQLVQHGIRRRDLLAHLQRGHRIHADGTTLLVEYANCEGSAYSDLAGHAVYTREPWMLFHLEETVKHFYEDTNRNPKRQRGAP